MLDDALDFHADLAAAERARPASPAMAHAIVGVQQPIWTTLATDDDHIQPFFTNGGDDDYGDRTVPLSGALG